MTTPRLFLSPAAQRWLERWPRSYDRLLASLKHRAGSVTTDLFGSCAAVLVAGDGDRPDQTFHLQLDEGGRVRASLVSEYDAPVDTRRDYASDGPKQLSLF